MHSLSRDRLKWEKLQRRLKQKHSAEVEKSVDFFKWKEDHLAKQPAAFVQSVTVPEWALKASFLASYYIAHAKKPHTTGEDLILPKTLLENCLVRMLPRNSMLYYFLIILWANRLVTWVRTGLLNSRSRWELVNISHLSWMRAGMYAMLPNCLCTLDPFPRKGFFLRKYYFGKHLKVEPLGETIFKFWTSASNLMDWSCYVWGCSNGSAAMTGMNTAPIKQKALNAVATHLVAKRIDD